MKTHRKKMIAPIIITILIVLYFLGLAALYSWIKVIPVWIRIPLILIPLAMIGVMIGVLYSRIKEIRSGEEDDLSNY